MTERIDQIAGAIVAVEPTSNLYLIVVSGDIANTGAPAEYANALVFFRTLREKILKERASARLEYITVPGNHDCTIPKDQVGVREALIGGYVSSLEKGKEDAGILNAVLEVQDNYNQFRSDLGEASGTWNRTSGTVTISHDGHQIQLNLYNTALLSRRAEIQGQLQLPVSRFLNVTGIAPNVHISVSVLHHSYPWMESNNALALRANVERTSDLVLFGHQHFTHQFYKVNETGERVLYLEGGALQDENHLQNSAFDVLAFDLSSLEQKGARFRWKGGVYRQDAEQVWRPFSVNRSARTGIKLADKFEAFLGELGPTVTHKIKGPLKLDDIYVYLDFSVRIPGSKDSLEVKGDAIIQHVIKTSRVAFQGPAYSGKTTLAKVLFKRLYNYHSLLPLLLDAKGLKAYSDRKVVPLLESLVQHQYGATSSEPYRTASISRKVLIVDDWHYSDLDAEGRRQFLGVVSQHFGKVILFTDDIYQIQELAENSTEVMLQFDHAIIQPFSHVQRGETVDKWVKLGREHTGSAKELTREIEDTEKYLQSVIGKNTLPSLPFIVLCILQVKQEEKPESPEAGSYGYLYDVLVTQALSSSVSKKPQLEKKYVFLSLLAYRLFQEKLENLSTEAVRNLAQDYAESFQVEVDIDAMLNDLETGRVLEKVDGNYSFAHAHLFHFFVARYYKDNLGREGGDKLRDELFKLVDNLLSQRDSTVLMFVLYFARDSARLIDRLVANAARIYQDQPAATLDNDVDFLGHEQLGTPQFELPTEVNVEGNRNERRRLQDEFAKMRAETEEAEYGYSEGLTDPQKLRLALKHIDLLGQVIRNFPGSLPGTDKLRILEATYQLGLRAISALFRILRTAMTDLNKILASVPPSGVDPVAEKQIKDAAETIRKFINLTARVSSVSMIMKVGSSVGLRDLERAYAEALKKVGESNATLLIDFAIRLEHSGEIPLDRVKRLQALMADNLLAEDVLKILVIANMLKYGTDHRTLQQVGSAFKIKVTSPRLIEATRKKD